MLLSYVRSSKQLRKATKKVFSQDDDDDEGHFGSGLTFVVDDKYQQQQFQICEWCAYGSFYSCYDARKHGWLITLSKNGQHLKGKYEEDYRGHLWSCLQSTKLTP